MRIEEQVQELSVKLAQLESERAGLAARNRALEAALVSAKTAVTKVRRGASVRPVCFAACGSIGVLARPSPGVTCTRSHAPLDSLARLSRQRYWVGSSPGEPCVGEGFCLKGSLVGLPGAACGSAIPSLSDTHTAVMLVTGAPGSATC